MSDPAYMRRALALAEKGRGYVSPNPMVGAVVGREGVVVGEGFHERVGGPHAEVGALTEAGERAKGATLYVNLEPCVHFGRTPPCADLVIRCGVKEVVCAGEDPDPKVSGRGFERLRAAGVAVRVGVLREEAERLNAAYFKHRRIGLPLVTLKWAQSLDGRIATATGDSRWITGEAARARAHRMRAESDAVLVGIGTVLADDPELTVRQVEGRNPRKIVLDSRLRLPDGAKVLSGAPLIVATTLEAPSERIEALRGRGVEVWAFPPAPDGRPDLADVLREAARQGVLSLLIEGGAHVAASALNAGLVDRLAVFIAPKLIGAGREAVGDLHIRRIADSLLLMDVQIERLGDDLLYTATGSRQEAGGRKQVEG